MVVRASETPWSTTSHPSTMADAKVCGPYCAVSATGLLAPPTASVSDAELGTSIFGTAGATWVFAPGATAVLHAEAIANTSHQVVALGLGASGSTTMLRA
jgi:hypothetical protein